ncbi:reverse transcriptase domain-containing protein [Tanacetum coccineum]
MYNDSISTHPLNISYTTIASRLFRCNSVAKSTASSLNERIVTDSPTDPNKSGPSLSGPTSYAKLVTGEPSRKSVNFRTLLTPAGNEADVAISLESVGAVSEVLLIHSKDGIDAMLENGPWLILNISFILNKWNQDVNLLKEVVGNVPIWVKFHGVPMTAFSEGRLSVIATKLGTPLMLDFYISDMCMRSWGRSSYARAMIELRADAKLKDTIMVAMPKLVDECPKKIVSDVVKNLKNSRQIARGVEVGPKVGSKPTK